MASTAPSRRAIVGTAAALALALSVPAIASAASSQDQLASGAQSDLVPSLACFKDEVDEDYAPLTVRPTKCTNAGYETSNAEMWILIKLTWSSWGTEQATGSGYLSPVHFYPGLEDPKYKNRPAKVTAYSVSDECGPDQPIFTKIRISAPAWKIRVRTSTKSRWKTRRLRPFTTVVNSYSPDC